MPSSNAPDRSLELRTVALALWSLAAVATSLRMYVRTRILKSFAIDDWFMMFAMLSFTANTITSVLGTYHGSGRHLKDLVITDAMEGMMFWWACYPTFAITMVLSKFSVGFFLLRITTQKIHRWIIYSALGASVASSVAFFFVAIFQCSPVQFAWTRFVSTDGTCLELDTIVKVTITYSTFAIITDFTFTLLPAWLVWNLQMDKRTKFAIIPILGMACIASCAVAVRLAFLNDFKSPDFLWATTDIAIWSQTEQGLAIAAGSFATLRPLFRTLVHALGLTSASRGGGGNTGNQSNLPSGVCGVGAGYKFKSASTFGGGGGNSARDKMFSLSTFRRISDDHDDLEKGLSVSTTELTSPVSDRSGAGSSGDRTGKISDDEPEEYRVSISPEHSLPRYPPVVSGPPPPRKDFEAGYVPSRGARD